MSDIEQDSTEALCPRCGGGANWAFLDDSKEIVEILCPDCGRFELSRAEFEEAEFDSAQADQRQE